MKKRLPPKAYARAMGLLEAEQQALTLSTSTSQKISEAQQALALNPHGPHADDIRLEIEHMEAARLRYQDQYRQRANLRAQVEHYLSKLPPDASLADAKGLKAKLKEGETLLEALKRVRGQIAELTSEQSAVKQASLPLGEMKALAKKWIDERAASARPTITASQDRFSINFVDPTAFTSHVDPIGALCWLDPERMKARLFEQIDSMPKSRLALNATEKAERLRELQDALFDVERQEEAFIIAAEDVGQIVPRRVNASPAAILGLIVDSRRASAA